MPPADNHSPAQHHAILRAIARRALLQAGLLADFPPAALAELARIDGPASTGEPGVRDLRALPWCSIDNDDSRDLDQLTVAEAAGDDVRVTVAVADVDTLVKPGSALDGRARHNTASVYTPAAVFPMLPEKLSTDLTSLNPGVDRLAVTVEMTVGGDGELKGATVFRALVRNRAQLAYGAVGAWLEGVGPKPEEVPERVAEVPGLADNLRLQDRAAQALKKLRHRHGALGLETLEARAVFRDGAIAALQAEKKNRAMEIIEDFMIAANGATARFLAGKGVPSLRRVVRTPKRWDRIVELAAEAGATLPELPDSGALASFLEKEKARDPLRFPDLSLAVIKLLGPGEYVVEVPGRPAPGHFGLAVKDYAHSTAPNRRFPDLVTQRLLKAALAGAPQPYRPDDLAALARHCTETEDAIKKVERQVVKSAAAILMESRIGERFEAFVTGAADKGTWVRLLALPVEGKLVQGEKGLDVGLRLTVQLVRTDVERGYIDFKRV